MKIFWINGAPWLDELKPELEKLGHEFVEDDPDVIIGWSVTQMDRIWRAFSRFPAAKLVNYNWDVYGWVWERPRKGEYNYKLYGALLKNSDEVWCPSQCTVERMKQWFGKDGLVIKTFIPLYEHETKDENYALCSLREIPDQNLGWFEKACEELKIPYVSNRHHTYTWEEWKRIVANCSFIVAPYYELSTGGLDIIQGYYLGKPGLLSDSSWNGGWDYLGHRAFSFKHDSYEDFKVQLKKLWETRPKVEKDHKEFVKENYSIEVMAKKISERLCTLITKTDS